MGLLAGPLVGCGEPEANGRPAPEERAGEGAEERAGERVGDAPVGGAARGAEPTGRILVVGTSLTAGPGINPEATYPARLQERIDGAGLAYRVINAGVSGETSAGALRRLDWLLREPADIVILETGANDMLRGLEPDSTRSNLDAILRRLRQADPPPLVLLAPMRALPNLGRDYGRRFEAIYADVAARHDVTLLPFLLDGVAGDRSMNLPDGMHPNARGHERMAENLWPALRQALR